MTLIGFITSGGGRILEPFGEPHRATDHRFARVPHHEDFDRYEIEAFVSSLYEVDQR